MPPRKPPHKLTTKDGDNRPDFDYNTIPSHYKCTFVLNARNKNTLAAFIQTVTWIRKTATRDGTTFDKIPNLNGNNNCPFMEVELKYICDWASHSVKLLILRSNLYLEDFLVDNKGYQLAGCPFKILGFDPLTFCTEQYHPERFPRAIGPAPLISALEKLCDKDMALERRVAELQTFFVHFCESSRFHIVEDRITETLTACGPKFEGQEEDGEDVPFTNERGEEVISKRDSDQEFEINVQLSANLPDIIRAWDRLSKVWYMYCLSEKRLRVLEDGLIRSCRLRSFDSIRSVLAVLANSHSGKVLGELKSKSTSATYRNYNSQDHTKVDRDFKQLQNSGLAFLPKYDEEYS